MGSLTDLAQMLPTGLVDATEAYWRAFAAALRPDPDITVSQWADRFRVLSAKASAEPGRWRTSRVPFMREVMDCLSPSHPCSEVTFQKGTQIAGTEGGYNWIGAVIDQWPGPMMLVMPTVDTAKRNSKQRLQPMIDETPCLREKVSDARSRDSGNTILMKEFPGGVLVIVGANSGPGLRSMPVRFLMLDEIDAYDDDVDGEGDPCVLAEKRTSTFARRKIYRVSSPKRRGGRIERYYEASDQRRYHVSCGRCWQEQWLRWEQMRWKLREVTEYACMVCGALNDSASPTGGCGACAAPADGLRVTTRETEHVERAWYECEACQGEIGEHEKTRMFEDGHWVAHKPGAGRPPGFHLSALYSPLGWFSWRDAVKQRIEADADTSGELLKTWSNTVLGEGWEQPGTKFEPHLLRSRVERYRLGQVPAGALLLTAGVDVQSDRLEVKVKGWGRGEESWLVDWQQIFGDPIEPYVWTELEALLSKAYPHEWGATLRIVAMAIDSGGHHTQQVYLFARKWARRHVFAVKGASQPGRPVLGRPSEVDITHQGKVMRGSARVFLVGTDTAKSVIYNRLRITEDGPGRMHFPDGLPDNYFDQLTAERRVDRYVKGFVRHEWVKTPGARNEALDCEVYDYAAAIYAGVTRVNWDQLEESIRQMGLFSRRELVPIVSETVEKVAETPKQVPVGPPTAAVAARAPAGRPRTSFAQRW